MIPLLSDQVVGKIGVKRVRNVALDRIFRGILPILSPQFRRNGELRRVMRGSFPKAELPLRVTGNRFPKFLPIAEAPV
jgi:hypothetical protein